MSEHFRPHAAVYMVFRKNGKILMLRRANTGYEDGMYSLPAGHIDGNETLRTAAVRETQEETGVVIAPEDLAFELVMHRNGDREYLDFFFSIKDWRGEPHNSEPHKCDDLSWFPITELPENTIPYVREAIHDIENGVRYAEFGWPTVE